VRQPDHRAEVDVDDLLVLGQRDLVEAAAEGDAGVVDQQPQPRVRGRDPLPDRDHRGRVAEVDHVRLGVQPAGDRGQPLRVPVQQHQPAAAAGQLARQRRPDPARRAGHHRRTAAEHVPFHQRNSTASVTGPRRNISTSLT
jgi:hypothetical protein